MTRLALALALLLALDYFLFSFVRILDAADAPDLLRCDAIVVFSGDPARIHLGFDLLAQEKAPRLFIAGVDNGAEVEAEKKKRPALFDCCVTVEAQSQNTHADAMAIARWAQRSHVRSLIVVTTNIHMPRAIAELGGQLPDASLIGAGVAQGIYDSRDWRHNRALWGRLQQEWAKYAIVRAGNLIGWHGYVGAS